MGNLALCQACRREADADFLDPVMSVLDFQLYDLCPSCIYHQAEPLIALVRTVHDKSESASWNELPEEIRVAIRVYDLGEYVTVREWAERLSKRQLVVREGLDSDPEDEAALQRMREIRERMDQPPRPPRRGKWLIAIITFFVPWRLA